MNFSSELLQAASRAEARVRERFEEIDARSFRLTERVLRALSEHKVDAACFDSVSGYGYDDRGREILDRVFADVFECEAALVRHNFVSGTHALTVGLFGLLRPGDTLLCVTGEPYDTLDDVIGAKSHTPGSLYDFGVNFEVVELKDGKPDREAILSALTPKVKVVYFQRSRGYADRPTLTEADFAHLFPLLREKTDAFLVVDNCYGEFVSDHEPTYYGADLVIGSLIKNAGGGMCETGGYLAGSQRAVDLCADRLTAPGLGGHVGATLGQNKNLFKGLFYAPHTTAQALKSALFAAALFEEIGYEVSPTPDEERFDIIQSVFLRDAEKVIAFCGGLQEMSPVDSYVTPLPAPMPGYAHEVIMAAGTFTQGASIELSADAPMREPYTVYLQGGLTYESAKLALLSAAARLLDQHR
ncbi:MAG: methionine gamma-lyase family protein [Clostridia bacterium]|nr:methionine gamma-lyase family protein [Clostridia bacterium]